MNATRSTTVAEHVARSRALRKEMDRAGEHVARGLRDAAAAIRRAQRCGGGHSCVHGRR